MRWLFVLLLLGACASQQLIDDNESSPILNTSTQVRPVIPRTDVRDELPPPETVSQERRSFLNATIFLRQGPAGVVAGDGLHPLLMGKTLGNVLPALRRGDLPLLSMQNPTYPGGPIRAEPYIRFDFGENSTGELRFVRDPDTDRVSSELFFEEGKVMFEYAYLLLDGAFPALEGQEFDFFGVRYLIHEANNETVILYGADAEQHLALTNGSRLSVDGKRYSDTNVVVDPWSIIIQYVAPEIDEDGIRIKPGQSLREKLRVPEVLLNHVFDIVYDGLEQNPNATLEVEQIGKRARIGFVNTIGAPIAFDIATNINGQLVLGDGERTIHMNECRSFDDFCIGKGDQFFVIARDGTLGIFEFRNVNEQGTTLELEDGLGETHLVKLAETKRNVSGRPVLDGAFTFRETPFRLRVRFNETPVRDRSHLSVDLDGSGSPSNKEIPLVLYYDYELTLGSINNKTISLQLEGPRVRNDVRPELLNITLSAVGEDVLVSVEGNLSLHEDEEDEELFFGLTAVGSFVTLDKSRDGVRGEDLLVEYPQDFRAGLVRIIG